MNTQTQPSDSSDSQPYAHPTLPSRLIATSFCASTANSIGKLLQHVLDEAVDQQRDRLFRRKAALRQ